MEKLMFLLNYLINSRGNACKIEGSFSLKLLFSTTLSIRLFFEFAMTILPL